MNKLNNKQKSFCQEYLKLGMNATQAYINVYKCKSDKVAGVNSSRLLGNANIQEYIKELQGKVEEKAIVKIDDIVNELSVIAFGDRTEIAKLEKDDIIDDGKVIGTRTRLNITETDKLSDDAKKIINGYKVTKSGISVENCDKMKALELLGKYLGMFPDKSKLEISGDEPLSIKIDLVDE